MFPSNVFRRLKNVSQTLILSQSGANDHAITELDDWRHPVLVTRAERAKFYEYPALREQRKKKNKCGDRSDKISITLRL